MSDFAALVQRLNQISDNEAVMEADAPVAAPTNDIAATKNLLQAFNEIQDANPYQPVVAEAEEAEVEETMQDRFAKFMKAEREAGNDIDTMKSMIDEGTVEYEYADRAFNKMAELINSMEKMVREGGMLETKIAQAGGDSAALADMRQALSDAYEACEQAHYDALGNTPEQQPED